MPTSTAMTPEALLLAHAAEFTALAIKALYREAETPDERGIAFAINGAFLAGAGAGLRALAQPAPGGQEPYYCTCSANGIWQPSAHDKDCRMSQPPPPATPPPTGWRDIATAPKDGTDVLLFATWIGNGRPVIGCGGWRKNGSEVYQWSWTWACEPTHWQPLPAPPTQETEG